MSYVQAPPVALLNQVSDRIDHNDMIKFNIGLIICMPYDVNKPEFLELVVAGLAREPYEIRPTPEQIALIREPAIDRYDFPVMVEQYKLKAVLEYFERNIHCATPLLHNSTALIVQTESAYGITFEDQDFGEEIKQVLVCRTEDLSSSERGYLVYHGTVYQRGSDAIVIVSHCDKNGRNQRFPDDTRFTVFEKPWVHDFEAQMAGLHVLKHEHELRSKIFPANVLAVRTNPTQLNADDLEGFEVNQCQREAILEMSRSPQEKAFLLFGPPGTGKTFTLVAFLHSLIRRIDRQSQQTRPKREPVLVVVPTNVAGDELVERMVLLDLINPKRIHRIMASRINPAYVRESVNKVTSTYPENGRHYYYVQTEAALKRYDIIVATIGVCRRFKNLGKNHFRHIVFDESGQTDENETLIPLGFFANPSTHLYFAGDPKQLGKVMVIDCLSAHEKYFNTSALLRLSKLHLYQSNASLMKMLLQNFRSVPSVMMPYSVTCYDGRLQSMVPENATGSLANSPILDGQKLPIRLHLCCGEQRKNEETGSFWNAQEADLVLYYADRAVKIGGLNQDQIYVVVPYAAQKDFVKDLFQLNGLNGIKVDTVARFQGSENHLIITTLVRTDGLGFVGDFRRTNTAISRAKFMLIIIGDFLNLVQNRYYYDLAHHFNSVGCIYDANNPGVEMNLSNNGLPIFPFDSA